MLERISALLGGLALVWVVVVLLLVLVQLALQVYALIDLSRRTSVPGGRKWVWALLIVAGNLLGAVIYLAIGRSSAGPAPGDDRAGSREAKDRALDRLYGDREDR